MTVEVYWGSGSPYAWRALLALEVKRLHYVSKLIQFSTKEHKTPEFLKLNPRGKVPVLNDNGFVVYESLAIVKYLDDKYPDPPLFGRTPEESARIMKYISECNSYLEPAGLGVVRPVFFNELDSKRDAVLEAANTAREELRLLDERLRNRRWLVGETVTAADIMIYPVVALLERALGKPNVEELELKLAPIKQYFPAIAAWIKNVEALPGYEKTYPPHWRTS